MEMDEMNARSIAQSLGRISDAMEEKKAAIHVSGDITDVDAREGMRLIVDAQNAKEALRTVLSALREADKHGVVPEFVDEEDKEAFCNVAWDVRKLICECFEADDALSYLRDY